MFTRILVQIEMKKPTGTPRTTSLKCTARRRPFTEIIAMTSGQYEAGKRVGKIDQID